MPFCGWSLPKSNVTEKLLKVPIKPQSNNNKQNWTILYTVQLFAYY